jgi:translation initiation factor IF-2
LNISLERAVDYLKIKGIALKQIKRKISDDVYNVLCSQLLVTKGIKKLLKKWEKRKEKKEALR